MWLGQLALKGKDTKKKKCKMCGNKIYLVPCESLLLEKFAENFNFKFVK